MCKTLSTQTKAAVQTYRFEFGSDSRIFSISFKGLIREPEIRGILETVQGTLYEKCGKAIRSYLDSNNLNYSKFTVREKLTGYRKPIEFAGKLLHSPSCSVVDKWIGTADVYYGIMDYQHWMEDCCEGCYYAVARMPSAQNAQYQYNVISQTFHCAEFRKEELAHFAIRKDDGRHHLNTLDKEDTWPVLATFGCVDLFGLLINITNITTKQQAAEIANK